MFVNKAHFRHLLTERLRPVKLGSGGLGSEPNRGRFWAVSPIWGLFWGCKFSVGGGPGLFTERETEATELVNKTAG